MQPHTDALRTLLSSGLRRDEALVRLRDSGVSAIACVKALIELHPGETTAAKDLVQWLNTIPTPADAAEQARRWVDEHPGEAVAAAFATLGGPTVSVETIENQGSWFSLVTARDGDVSWRFVHERSVWTVDASPVWSPDERFDVDLLARHVLGGALDRPSLSIDERMGRAVADLVAEVGLLRRSVRDGFRQDTWPDTRARLQRLRHQRELERSGPRTFLSPP